MSCAKCDTMAQQLAELREMQRLHTDCLIRIGWRVTAYDLSDALLKKTGMHVQPDRPSDDT